MLGICCWVWSHPLEYGKPHSQNKKYPLSAGDNCQYLLCKGCVQKASLHLCTLADLLSIASSARKHTYYEFMGSIAGHVQKIIISQIIFQSSSLSVSCIFSTVCPATSRAYSENLIPCFNLFNAFMCILG